MCISFVFFEILFIVRGIYIYCLMEIQMPRRRNAVTKNLKDYMVPIIGLALIVILIFSVFFSGDKTPGNKDNLQTENMVWVDVTFDGDTTQ